MIYYKEPPNPIFLYYFAPSSPSISLFIHLFLVIDSLPLYIFTLSRQFSFVLFLQDNYLLSLNPIIFPSFRTNVMEYFHEEWQHSFILTNPCKRSHQSLLLTLVWLKEFPFCSYFKFSQPGSKHHM